MNVWAILPVKAPEHGKTRLASCLSAQERAQLSILLFRRTFRIVTTIIPPVRPVIISASAEILDAASDLRAVALKETARDTIPRCTRLPTSHGFRVPAALLCLHATCR